MVNDPIADMIIRIRNAQATHKETVIIPASKVKVTIAQVLKDAGYIGNIHESDTKTGRVLELTLRYDGKEPAITHFQRISKPGLRRYSDVGSIPRPLSGHGLVIISTTQGVMSGRQAQKKGLGGEIIATLW